MATGSFMTPIYSRSQSEVQGDLHKMSTKLAWELNSGGSRQTDHLTGPSAHAPRCPRESATKLSLKKSFRFQHDNDPKHTAEIVKLWLLYNVPNQLHTAPQSSDLNPTEHL
ncbi:hypothetical protein TNCV_452591 [Trichonephila clavipes]|nr:hypothetical protein TNCV_452591 [Trichonephila clavipes]